MDRAVFHRTEQFSTGLNNGQQFFTGINNGHSRFSLE